VLDSSVLIPVWSRVLLQRLAADSPERFQPVWSEWIIAETWRVLAWRSLSRDRTADSAQWRDLTRSANAMLRLLLPVMRMASLHQYTGPEPWPELRDVNDIPIWDTATAAGARYVVSHNTADFPPLVDGRHTWRGVEYVTAVELIEDVFGEDVALLATAPMTPAMLLRSRRGR
jgi:hypothetical protein